MIVTKPAPEFKTQAVMPDNSIQEVKLSDYKGKKVVLFFYPLDFTFVCPTELLAFDKRLSEFESRGVQVLGCSVDSRWSHLAWKNTDVNKGGIGNVQYPILQDLDKSIARSFDVLVGSTPATVYTQDKEVDTTVGGGVALRASFLIDEEGTSRLNERMTCCEDLRPILLKLDGKKCTHFTDKKLNSFNSKEITIQIYR